MWELVPVAALAVALLGFPSWQQTSRHVRRVHRSEGEPEAVPVVFPAGAPPVEPGSPSETPQSPQTRRGQAWHGQARLGTAWHGKV